ncbi:hypothetical protein BC826DRAFT_656203 [Russula brevipes]|nr:hypothetical protein BC826DRAFT_656203 [Russula brevipes]
MVEHFRSERARSIQLYPSCNTCYPRDKGKHHRSNFRAAQLRWLHSSDYGTSKFALGRLIEFAALEHPDLRVFALHPGVIETALFAEAELSGLTLLISSIIHSSLRRLSSHWA